MFRKEVASPRSWQSYLSSKARITGSVAATPAKRAQRTVRPCSIASSAMAQTGTQTAALTAADGGRSSHTSARASGPARRPPAPRPSAK
eukprot:64871-Chlamydomonas_euryale.AAC.2